MKKLISLLLAVSVMLASTSAFAWGLSPENSHRNYGSTSAGNSWETPIFREGPALYWLPGYQPGDTLTFKMSSESGVVAGSTVTFISTKHQASGYDNTTVQFIDQVVAEGTSLTKSYTLRDTVADGIYDIAIKVDGADIAKFYYIVGEPSVDIVYTDEDETVPYKLVGDTAYYFLKASLSGGANFHQVGVEEFGFDFGDGITASITGKAFADLVYEDDTLIYGEDNCFFSVAIDGVDAESVPAVDKLYTEKE